MPAVSGSPTQVKTSASTAADLAGTPDDAFLDGDLASVTALWPNSTFRLRRTALGTTPDNVTSIAAFSGNGYWELFGVGGSLSFETLAELVAFNDVGVADGGSAYVGELRSPWIKNTESPAPAGDGISVVPTASGDGAWYRQPMPQAWNDVAVMYLDGAAGTDTNDGLTALTAIQTLGELERRTYNPQTARAYLEVQVLSTLSGTSSFRFNSEIEFYGVGTPGATVQIDGAVAMVASPYTPQSVTVNDGGWAWTVGLLLEVSRLGVWDLRGWAVSDLGGGQTTTQIEDATGLVTPVIGDNLRQLTLPVVDSVTFEGQSGYYTSYIGFYDLDVNGCTITQANATFQHCVIQDHAMVQCVSYSFDRCLISGNVEVVDSGDTGSHINGVLRESSVSFENSRGHLGYSARPLMVVNIGAKNLGNSPIRIGAGSFVTVGAGGVGSGKVEADNLFAVLTITAPSGSAHVEDTIYGANNSYLVYLVASATRVTYSNSAYFNSTYTTNLWALPDATAAVTSGNGLPAVAQLGTVLAGVFMSPAIV